MESLTPEILKRIDTVAAKLGVCADQLWATLIKQAGVEAQISHMHFTFSLVVVAVILALTLMGFVTLLRSKNEYNDDKVLCGTALIVGLMLALFVSCFSMSLYRDYLSVSQNPEYWALMELKRLLP